MLFALGKGDAERLEGISGSVSSNIVLLNYLRTPVTVDNVNMTMSDLIVLWYGNNEKYDSVLEQKSEEILNIAEYKFVEDKLEYTKSYSISIKTDRGFSKTVQSKSYSVSSGTPVVAFVPVDFNKTVEVRLN